MRDLLSLDYSHITNYKIIGIDIDDESISQAKELSRQLNISSALFLKRDAWLLNNENSFDVIVSSGLNFYESDPEKVLDLYRKFFLTLKPGGTLIISVLTYPPDEEKKSDWDLSKISEETIRLDRILHKYILDIKWRHFKTSSEIDQDFKTVGFTDIKVTYDCVEKVL